MVMRHPAEHAGGDPHPHGSPPSQDPPAAKLEVTTILADRRARDRVQALDRQHRISSELERLAPLTRFYGPRRPRAVPLGRFLVERWWPRDAA
jgi:hypothetical protein